MSKRGNRSRSVPAATTRRLVIVALLALIALSAVSGILVQAGGDDFALPWWTVDGGGGASGGAGFSLNGTAGQPDAGGLLQGGGYALQGGYWASEGGLANLLYLPLVRG